jgi:MFS transporter, AAHS family, 3-hydroxyphenylpropionic acid transporter
MESARDELKELKTYVVVFFCFLVIMLEGFDIQVAGVTAMSLAKDFGLGPAQVGTFMSASAFGVLIFAALGGMLADRYGRKPVLMVSTFVFGLFCLLTPFSPGFEALVIIRFLTGAGLGAAFPVVIAMTSDHSPKEQKKRWIGVVYSAISLGGMLAAALLAAHLVSSWKSVFYIGGVLPIIVAGAMYMGLPESNPIQVADKGAAATGSWRDILGPSKLAITLTLWLATFLTLAVMYMMVMWLPTLMKGKGLSTDDAFIVQMLYNLGSTVAAFVVGYALDRKHIFAVPTIGYAILAVSLAYLGGMPIDVLMGSIVGFMLGVGCTTGQTLLYAFAPLCYPPAIRATGVGYAIAAGRFGTMMGPFIAGMLLASGFNHSQVLLIVAPVAIVTLVVVLLVGRMLPGSTARLQETSGPQPMASAH